MVTRSNMKTGLVKYINGNFFWIKYIKFNWTKKCIVAIIFTKQIIYKLFAVIHKRLYSILLAFVLSLQIVPVWHWQQCKLPTFVFVFNIHVGVIILNFYPKSPVGLFFSTSSIRLSTSSILFYVKHTNTLTTHTPTIDFTVYWIMS